MNTYTPPSVTAIPQGIFRAYDIRGKAEFDLTSDVVYGIGLSLGSLLQDMGLDTVVLGCDGRLSSPRINEAMCGGLLKTGINIVHIGQVPTPLVYFATFHLGIQAGIMITGSHNPKDDNGIKISMHDPAKIQPLIQAIPKHMAKQAWHEGTGTMTTQDILPAYINKVAPKALNKNFNVVLDCGNGIAGRMAPSVFSALGCNVTPLFCEVDGNFPNHHPDPTIEKNLIDCKAKVKDISADVGFIFDGDADRVGVITHTGRVVWADQLMMLFAQDTLKNHPGSPIVFDIKCSDHLAACITSNGGQPILWQTGHTKIKTKMKAIGAPLAGEMSGHIFFNDEDWYGFDDGLYAAIRLLRILDQNDATLEDMAKALPSSTATPEILMPVEESKKASIIEHLKTLPELQAGTINDMDGLRISFKEGWGLVRPSNTTANLTLRFEANDTNALKTIMQCFHGALVKAGAIDEDYCWPVSLQD